LQLLRLRKGPFCYSKSQKPARPLVRLLIVDAFDAANKYHLCVYLMPQRTNSDASPSVLNAKMFTVLLLLLGIVAQCAADCKPNNCTQFSDCNTCGLREFQGHDVFSGFVGEFDAAGIFICIISQSRCEFRPSGLPAETRNLIRQRCFDREGVQFPDGMGGTVSVDSNRCCMDIDGDSDFSPVETRTGDEICALKSCQSGGTCNVLGFCEYPTPRQDSIASPCCVVDEDCPEMDPTNPNPTAQEMTCLSRRCSANNECAYVQTTNCCVSNDDCPENQPGSPRPICERNICVENQCTRVLVSTDCRDESDGNTGFCTTDQDCAPLSGQACSVRRCENNVCVASPNLLSGLVRATCCTSDSMAEQQCADRIGCNRVLGCDATPRTISGFPVQPTYECQYADKIDTGCCDADADCAGTGIDCLSDSCDGEFCELLESIGGVGTQRQCCISQEDCTGCPLDEDCDELGLPTDRCSYYVCLGPPGGDVANDEAFSCHEKTVPSCTTGSPVSPPAISLVRGDVECSWTCPDSPGANELVSFVSVSNPMGSGTPLYEYQIVVTVGPTAGVTATSISLLAADNSPIFAPVGVTIGGVQRFEPSPRETLLPGDTLQLRAIVSVNGPQTAVTVPVRVDLVPFFTCTSAFVGNTPNCQTADDVDNGLRTIQPTISGQAAQFQLDGSTCPLLCAPMPTPAPPGLTPAPTPATPPPPTNPPTPQPTPMPATAPETPQDCMPVSLCISENAITGLVWLDENNDNLYEAGEPLIPGVTFNLLLENGTIWQVSTSDAHGQYRFPYQVPDNSSFFYEVTPQVRVETIPVGFEILPDRSTASDAYFRNKFSDEAPFTSPAGVTSSEFSVTQFLGLRRIPPCERDRSPAPPDAVILDLTEDECLAVNEPDLGLDSLCSRAVCSGSADWRSLRIKHTLSNGGQTPAPASSVEIRAVPMSAADIRCLELVPFPGGGLGSTVISQEAVLAGEGGVGPRENAHIAFAYPGGIPAGSDTVQFESVLVYCTDNANEEFNVTATVHGDKCTEDLGRWTQCEEGINFRGCYNEAIVDPRLPECPATTPFTMAPTPSPTPAIGTIDSTDYRLSQLALCSGPAAMNKKWISADVCDEAEVAQCTEPTANRGLAYFIFRVINEGELPSPPTTQIVIGERQTNEPQFCGKLFLWYNTVLRDSNSTELERPDFRIESDSEALFKSRAFVPSIPPGGAVTTTFVIPECLVHEQLSSYNFTHSVESPTCFIESQCSEVYEISLPEFADSRICNLLDRGLILEPNNRVLFDTQQRVDQATAPEQVRSDFLLVLVAAGTIISAVFLVCLCGIFAGGSSRSDRQPRPPRTRPRSNVLRPGTRRSTVVRTER